MHIGQKLFDAAGYIYMFGLYWFLIATESALGIFWLLFGALIWGVIALSGHHLHLPLLWVGLWLTLIPIAIIGLSCLVHQLWPQPKDCQ